MQKVRSRGSFLVGLVKEEAKEGARGKLVLLAGGLEEGKEDVIGREKRKSPREGGGTALG